tara:strand:+ start:201 stop:431 length:231 start_codon:yes stop_codon:yes gene_type:complete
MTVIDHQNTVKYKKELLNFIYSELGNINYSKDKIISLIKEHKKASSYLNNNYNTVSFESKINLSEYDIAIKKIKKR